MGHNLAFLIAFVFSSCLAQAQFFNETEGLSRSRLEFGAIRVVAKVSIPQPGGGAMDCSGFYVSDRAHLMLASHCLESHVYGIPGNDGRMAKGIEVDGRVGDWHVRLVSPCRREQLKDNPKELQPIVDCEYYDLALLEPVNAMVAPGCVSLSEAKVPTGELVTLGFPRRTFRRNGNSFGRGVHFSFGDRADSPSCKIIDSSLGRVGSEFSLELALQAAAIESALQTSLDVFAGNSGGLVLEVATAKPVGVVSFTSVGQGFDPARERCVPGSSFISPLMNLDRAFAVMNQHGVAGHPIQNVSLSELPPELNCSARRQTLRR